MKLASQLSKGRQSPVHLLRVGGIPGPDAGLQLIEATRFAIGHELTLLTLTLVEGAQKGSLGLDATLETEAARHGVVAVARVTQGERVLV